MMKSFIPIIISSTSTDAKLCRVLSATIYTNTVLFAGIGEGVGGSSSLPPQADKMKIIPSASKIYTFFIIHVNLLFRLLESESFRSNRHQYYRFILLILALHFCSLLF